MTSAAVDLEKLRVALHRMRSVRLERKPGLYDRLLSRREQAIYGLILRNRQTTSSEVARALGDRAWNTRAAQRDLVCSAELVPIEKLGARWNAWRRPRGLGPDCDLKPIDAGVGVSRKVRGHG